MTPQERQLVDDLFDKLARLEGTPRDRDAEAVIADGLRRAPNAVYALVQTALVQDEALKRADAKIRELSGEDQTPAQGGGFLDSMRNAFGGGSGRGSVPSVRSGTTGSSGPDPRWNTGGAYAPSPAQSQPQGAPMAQPSAFGGGGSFLGTAAASAAGMIGGAMLMNSISSMFGHHGGAFGDGSAFGDNYAASPWSDSSSASNSDLARDAGLNDVASGGGSAGFFDNGDTGNVDTSNVADLGDSGGFDSDFGGDSGDSDSA